MPENQSIGVDQVLTPKAEDEIVQAAQEDLTAFAPLFDAYSPRVYRYALHRLGNVNDAEDVTSRTFTDALQNLEHYRPRKDGSFGGWLFTIARRRCADHFRRPFPVHLAEANVTGFDAVILEESISQDERQHLESVLRGLEESELELLRLRFAGDLTYREMGDILGKSEAAAKMSLTRLIKKLKVIWEEYHE